MGRRRRNKSEDRLISFSLCPSFSRCLGVLIGYFLKCALNDLFNGGQWSIGNVVHARDEQEEEEEEEVVR